MRSAESYEDFSEIKERLDWIVSQVSNTDMPLEQALSYYEEAVMLGMRVSTLIEDAQGEDKETADDEDAVATAAGEGSSGGDAVCDAKGADTAAPAVDAAGDVGDVDTTGDAAHASTAVDGADAASGANAAADAASASSQALESGE